MTRFILALTVLLSLVPPGAALAQSETAEDELRTFQVAMVSLLRVVVAPCPTGLSLTATQCYEHGYRDVFDFKEALFPLGFGLEPTELWSVTTLVAGGDAGPAYRASFRTRDEQDFTLTFVEGSLLVLEEGAAP